MAEETNAPKEEGGGGGLMSGTRGWIMVIAIVVLEAIFFGVLLILKDDKKPVDTAASNEGITKTKIEDFLRSKVELNNLTYSIPSVTGVPMTLAMSLTMMLEPTQREINSKVEITPLDWTKFEETVKKMTPMILDRLNSKINQMSVNDLQSQRGQEQIRDFVKETVNNELRKIDLKLSNKDIAADRVQRVLITSYYVQ